MTLKEFFDSTEMMCIHCPEEWMAKEFCSKSHELGKTFLGGESYKEVTYWERRKEEMSYTNGYQYGAVSFNRGTGYKVLSFYDIEDFTPKTKYKVTATGNIVAMKEGE